MLSNRTIRSSIFGAQADYLGDEDRYFFRAASAAPQYRLAIIGTGMIGMEHIRVTLLEGRAEIGGLYDSSAQSLQTAEALVRKLQRRAPKRYNTLEAACTDSNIDALIISTPNHTHRAVLETAMKSNKPILLEKPMASTIGDAYQIFQYSQHYPGIIQIGLQYRYKSIYRECYAEAMRRRSLGTLRAITIAEHRLPFLDKVGQWNKFSAYSGGTLVEKCCHYFDLFNLFAASRPISVVAVGDAAVNFKGLRHGGRNSDMIDHACVIVTYQNGIKANFNLCMFSPMFHEEITLCGDEGRIHAYETEDFLPGNKIKSGFSMRCSNGLPAKDTALHYPTVIEESGHGGSTFFEHVRFMDNIARGGSGGAGGGDTEGASTEGASGGTEGASGDTEGASGGTEGASTDSATVEEGLWSVIVGAAAEESVRTGEVVRIDEYLKRVLPNAQL